MELIAFRKKKIKSHFGRKKLLVEDRLYAAMLLKGQKLGCRLTWKQLLGQSLLCTYKISHDITQYQSVLWTTLHNLQL